jgi:hypothetical protein
MALENQIGREPLKIPSGAAIRSLCARFAAAGLPDPAKNYEACREMLEAVECRVTVRDAKRLTIRGNLPIPEPFLKKNGLQRKNVVLDSFVSIPFEIACEVTAA